MEERTGVRTTAVVRGVAVAITAGVGAAGFALSFTALRDLAVRGHVPVGQAWLWPFMVDGAILLATLGVVVTAGDPRRRSDRRFFWLVLIGGAVVSVTGNALHAVLAAEAPLAGWLRGCLAAVAPLALLVTTHGLTLLTRMHHRVTTTVSAADAGTEPTGAPAEDHDHHPAVLPLSDRPHPTRADGRRAETGEHSVTSRHRWSAVAERVLERVAVKDVDVVEVAEILRLSFDHTATDREIGRQLRMSHHTVSKVVTAGAAVLRSNDDAAAPVPT